MSTFIVAFCAETKNGTIINRKVRWTLLTNPTSIKDNTKHTIFLVLILTGLKVSAQETWIISFNLKDRNIDTLKIDNNSTPGAREHTDFAILELEKPIGDKTGWISIGFDSNDCVHA